MKIKPLNDRVLVKRMEEVQVTKGGILIPDTAKEKPIEGKVIAVGPGKMSEPAPAWPCNSKKATGCSSANMPAPKSRWKAKNILMMREEDILAVIND